jgi:hypothetical protein
MEDSRRFSLGFIALIVLIFPGLIIPGLLLTGCNNSPNTSSNAGPTVLLTLAPANSFTWPPNTPYLTYNAVKMLAPSTEWSNAGGTIQWSPSESSPPTYDWFAAIAPGDNSGIRYLSVNITFYSDCNGQISGSNPATPWSANQTFGSPSGPVLATVPLYIVELSSKVIGPYTCTGQTSGLGSTPPTFPGGRVGLYFIQATSTNGNGVTTGNNASFLITIGKVDGINYGPQ